MYGWINLYIYGGNGECVEDFVLMNDERIDGMMDG